MTDCTITVFSLHVAGLLPASASRQAMTIAKILISYMQIADAFSLFQNVRWPHVFTAFLQAINLSRIIGVQVWVGDLLLPAECAVGVSFGERTRLIVTLLLPLLVSAAFLGLATLVAARAKPRGPATPATLGELREILSSLCSSPAFYNIHIWMLRSRKASSFASRAGVTVQGRDGRAPSLLGGAGSGDRSFDVEEVANT